MWCKELGSDPDSLRLQRGEWPRERKIAAIQHHMLKGRKVITFQEITVITYINVFQIIFYNLPVLRENTLLYSVSK